MGLTYDQAKRVGLEHLHPLHGSPFAAGKATAKAAPMAPKGRPITNKNELGQNKTEAAFSRRLAELKHSRAILDYGFETMKFRLAQRTWYTPDFPVVLPDFSLVLAETKGSYIRPDGMLKLKVAAEQIAFPFFLCVYAERRWTITRIPSRNSRELGIDIFDIR